jgi:hypothetical protein
MVPLTKYMTWYGYSQMQIDSCVSGWCTWETLFIIQISLSQIRQTNHSRLLKAIFGASEVHHHHGWRSSTHPMLCERAIHCHVWLYVPQQHCKSQPCQCTNSLACHCLGFTNWFYGKKAFAGWETMRIKCIGCQCRFYYVSWLCISYSLVLVPWS